MSNNRELSQFAAYLEVDDNTDKIAITTSVSIGGSFTSESFYGDGRNLKNVPSIPIPSGSLGQIQYNYEGTDTRGSLDIYYDYFNGLVGIGTSIPTSKLSVSGNVDIKTNLSVGSSITSPIIYGTLVGGVQGNATGLTGLPTVSLTDATILGSLTVASINASSGFITATQFVGELVGSATTATNFNVAADNTTNSTHYVIFTGGATGNQRPNSDNALTYNPSTNTLTAGTFNGAINASNISSGTLNTARLPSNITVSGTVSGGLFAGNGASLTGLNASNISSGTLNTARLPSNITVSGTITASDFNSTSDIRLKENVETIDNALELISSIRGVKFDWKTSHRRSVGVIAQEVEAAYPDLVNDGEVKTVNYNGIIALLIEAVKELKSELDNIKTDK
jgi:hypothetical protein